MASPQGLTNSSPALPLTTNARITDFRYTSRACRLCLPVLVRLIIKLFAHSTTLLKNTIVTHLSPPTSSHYASACAHILVPGLRHLN
jgi:hypothetical protein